MNIHCKYLISSFIIVACCLQQSCWGQSSTVRPYKFGFTIDEQQHRRESRDERGIVMGEFGFITADGIYHVTVYATDEQGRFRILAMKNYPYESPPKTVEVMVRPKVAPTTTTTTTLRPTLPRINYGAEACSGCFLPNKPKGANGVDTKTVKNDIRPLSKPLPNTNSNGGAASGKFPNKNSNPAIGSQNLSKTQASTLTPHTKNSLKAPASNIIGLHKTPSSDEHKYELLALSILNQNAALFSNSTKNTPSHDKSHLSSTKPSAFALKGSENPLNSPINNNKLHHNPSNDKLPYQLVALSISNPNGAPLFNDKTSTALNNALNPLNIKPIQFLNHNNLPTHKVAAQENTLANIFKTGSTQGPLSNSANSRIFKGVPTSLNPNTQFSAKPLNNQGTSNKSSFEGPNLNSANSATANRNLGKPGVQTPTPNTQYTANPTFDQGSLSHTPSTQYTTKPTFGQGSFTQTPGVLTPNTQYTAKPLTSQYTNHKTSKPSSGKPGSVSPVSKTNAGKQPPIMDIIMQEILPTLMGTKGQSPSSKPTLSTTLNNKPNAVPSGSKKPSSSASGLDANRKSGGGAGSSSAAGGDGDLYRFKYLLDYNGHRETGKRNGNKEGSYYSIGDDNVERTIEYVANEFGYQPRIRWRKLDANEIKSKENTLKDYEFVWFNE